MHRRSLLAAVVGAPAAMFGRWVGTQARETPGYWVFANITLDTPWAIYGNYDEQWDGRNVTVSISCRLLPSYRKNRIGYTGTIENGWTGDVVASCHGSKKTPRNGGTFTVTCAMRCPVEDWRYQPD